MYKTKDYFEYQVPNTHVSCSSFHSFSKAAICHGNLYEILYLVHDTVAREFQLSPTSIPGVNAAVGLLGEVYCSPHQF